MSSSREFRESPRDKSVFAVQIMSPSCYGSRANDDDLATTGKAKEVHLVMYILTVSLVWKYFV